MIKFSKKSFDDLTKKELYAILKFRMEIFILEQKSFYLDLDDEDQHAIHFTGIAENKLVVYGRVTMNQSIAQTRRICVDKNFRNQGLGSLLMDQMLEHINTLNIKTVELDAQIHLQKFYGKYGFKSVGGPYDEGGVMHILMRKE